MLTSEIPLRLGPLLTVYLESTIDDALLAFAPNERDRAIYDVARAIRKVVDAALAPHLRTYNAVVSRQHRLPNEVWCAVWGHLPLKDKLAVSAVCHAWRTVAVCCPALRTQVEIPCSEHCCDQDDCTASANRRNAQIIAEILSRSKQLPLYVQIFHRPAELVALDAPRAHISDSLGPHAARIARIHIHCRNTIALSGFLPAFDFSALQDLSISPHNVVSRLFLAPATMPALEHLDLATSLPVFDERHVSFRSLQRLALAFLDPAGIERTLADAPQLAVFTLRFVGHFTRRPTSAALRQRIARIPELHLRGVVQQTATWLPDQLDLAAQVRTSIDFDPNELYVSLAMLGDIAVPTHIDCAARDDSVTILVREADGRARLAATSVRVFADAFRELWDGHLWGPRFGGVSLMMDCSIWRGIPAYFSGAGIRTLTLRLAARSDLDSVDEEDEEESDEEYPTRPAFPDLQHVVLKAGALWSGELQLWLLCAILDKLRCDRPLQSVNLEGLVLEEDKPSAFKTYTRSLTCVPLTQERGDLAEFLDSIARA